MATAAQINQLLVDSKEYDPDKRYMAANDLTNEILRDDSQLSENTVRQICTTLLSQLDDQSIDVQGNAVRCLKKIATKLPEAALDDVINKLGQCLLEGKKEFKDIYATCIKGFIADIPDTSSHVIIDILFPILNSGLNVEGAQEESADILTEVFRRFSQAIYNSRRGYETVQNLTQLLNSDNQTLKKKVNQCLGASSAVLQPYQLQELISHLLHQIRSARQLTHQLTFIQGLSSVARTTGYKLSNYLSDIFDLLRPKCDVRNLSLDSPEIDLTHEVIELCLTTFESLIRRCPKEVTNLIEPVIEMVSSLISYDPNYTYDQDQEADDDWSSDFGDSDEFSEGDGDDSSWKVRRAAVNVLDAIIKSRPDSLTEYYSRLIDILTSRLKERDENVKLDIFSTFSNLIRSIIVGDVEGYDNEELPSLVRTRSSALSIHEYVPGIIDAVLKELGQKSVKTRQGLTSFLLEMSLSLPEKVVEQLPKLINELCKSLQDKNNSNIRLDTLQILERLYRGSQNYDVLLQTSQTFLQHIADGIDDEYYRITAEGLRVAGNLIKVLCDQNSIVNLLFPKILQRLSTTDIDQEVKQAAIFSASLALSAAGGTVAIEQALQAVDYINDRMKNEVTRQSALKAWVRFSQSQTSINLDLTPQLAGAVTEMAGLLQKNSRSLKIVTLEALAGVCDRYNLSQDSAQLLLQNLPGFINDTDLHLAQYALNITNKLLERQSNIPSQIIQQIVQNMQKLAQSSLVQGGALNQLCICYQTIASKNLYQADQLVSQLQAELDNVGKQGLDTSARCASQVIYNSQLSLDNYINQFVSNFNGNEQQIQFSVLCIGYIGQNTDLSRQSNLFDNIKQIFDHQNEQVRSVAAYALGNLASGNVTHYLPQLLQPFTSRQFGYLQLIALREVIIIHFSHMQPYINTIKPILFEHCESQDDSIRNLVAECLGKLYLSSAVEMMNEIQSHIQQGSPLARSTVITSIKFAAASKQANQESIDSLIPPLLNCLDDDDINIKKNVIVSLTAIAHNFSSLLKFYIEELLLKSYNEVTFRPDLVRTVDLGPFKHQIDDGLALRKAAFNLLETLMDTLPDKIEHGQLATVIVKGLDDPSDEVQMLCHQIIYKQAQWSSGAVLAVLDTVIDIFQKTLDKQAKLLANKQEVERATDMIRSCLRAIENLKAATDTDTNLKFVEFYGTLQANEQYSQILQGIKSQRETLMVFQISLMDFQKSQLFQTWDKIDKFQSKTVIVHSPKQLFRKRKRKLKYKLDFSAKPLRDNLEAKILKQSLLKQSDFKFFHTTSTRKKEIGPGYYKSLRDKPTNFQKFGDIPRFKADYSKKLECNIQTVYLLPGRPQSRQTKSQLKATQDKILNSKLDRKIELITSRNKERLLNSELCNVNYKLRAKSVQGNREKISSKCHN